MKDIDFLPEWYVQARARRDRRISRFSLAGIALLALAVWFAMGALRVRQVQLQVNHLATQNRTVEPGLEFLEQLKNEQARLLAKCRLAKDLGMPVSCVQLLSRLAALMPPEVGLRQFRVVVGAQSGGSDDKANLASLAAQVSSGGHSQVTVNEASQIKISLEGLAATEMHVAVLVGQLSGDERFQDVKLEYCRAAVVQGCHGHAFQVTFTIEPHSPAATSDEEV